MAKEANKSYCHFGGCAWPMPGARLSEVNWQLRYNDTGNQGGNAPCVKNWRKIYIWESVCKGTIAPKLGTEGKLSRHDS